MDRGLTLGTRKPALEVLEGDLLFRRLIMDANTVALALIQKWVGPDDKITDMSAFYDALVKALI